MYPLLFTTAFLMLMALFASTEVANFKMGTLEKNLYENHLLTYRSCQMEKYEAFFDYFEEGNGGKAKSPKETTLDTPSSIEAPKENKDMAGARSLNFKETRPPNNSRLNFYHLLHEQQQSYYPQGFSIYEVTAELLRKLYGDTLLAERGKESEYHLLDALIAQKEKSKEFIYPDELASIELGDPSLQNLLQQMLKGGYLGKRYPSLLDYITFDSGGTSFTRKINFLSISEPFLSVLIKDSGAVAALLEKRKVFWEEILYQEKNRSTILQKDAMGRLAVQKRAQEILEGVLASHGLDPICYKGLFDYSLGKKGTIIYVRDGLTKSNKREKIAFLAKGAKRKK